MVFHNIPTLFAISTFLARPTINLFIPSEKLSALIFFVSNSSSTVSYLTIGPAIICVNNVV